VVFVVVPAARGVRYLLTSPELSRTRGRAFAATGAVVGAAGVALAVVPAPDHVRAEGVAEPERLAIVYAGASGFALELDAGWAAPVSAGETLVRLDHDETRAQLAEVEAERRRAEAQRRAALAEDPAAAAALAERLAALDERRARLERDLEQMQARAPVSGVWAAPELARSPGRWVERGERLGVIADTSSVVVRAAAPQTIAALLVEEARSLAELRVRGRPGQLIDASVRREEIRPAGQRRLPSAALGYAAGGLTPIDPTAEDPTMAQGRFFETLVRPEPGAGLLPGQRVIVRFRLDDRPLAAQGWRWLRQTVQSRLDL
jgi:putative peptide zinc metalloprotease protein